MSVEEVMKNGGVRPLQCELGVLLETALHPDDEIITSTNVQTDSKFSDLTFRKKITTRGRPKNDRLDNSAHIIDHRQIEL